MDPGGPLITAASLATDKVAFRQSTATSPAALTAQIINHIKALLRLGRGYAA
jgi:hypothetical protein